MSFKQDAPGRTGIRSRNGDFIISFCDHRSMRIGNGTRCHKNVIPMVVNGGKMPAKCEQRRRNGFIRFGRNGDSGTWRSVFRDVPITGSGVIAIMIPG
jgi:hypothetical protein